MDEGADGVHVGVAVGNHDTFGPRGGAAGVVDRQQALLVDLGFCKIG